MNNIELHKTKNFKLNIHVTKCRIHLQLIKAEDPGKLSSTATVNIKVTDINDKNPEFDESSLPYTFKVKEGD